MNKLIRKYNKWLLAVFGVLLMVTFLIQGTASQFRADPGKIVVAKLGSRDIKRMELGEADREYKYLEDCAPAFIKGQIGIENSLHWFLLTHQAEDAGLVGDVQDGASFVTQVAHDEAIYGINPQFLQMQQFQDTIKKRIEETKTSIERRRVSQGALARYTPEDGDRVWAKLRGIVRLLSAEQGAPRLSDRAAIIALKKQVDSVSVDALVVPARQLAATVAAPSEAELQAHFEKYQKIDPAKSDDGIGYVLPPRVKLEWLTIDKAAVTAAVKVDPIEINKTHLQNRTKYPGDFAAERVKIEKDLRDDLVTRVLADIDRVIKSAITFSTNRLPDDGSYKKVPSDWQRPKFEAIAQQVVEAIKTGTGVTLPMPSINSQASWATAEEVRKIPGVGSAGVRLGNQQSSFSEIVFAARELSPKTPNGVQVGVPFATAAAIDSATDNRHYFVVTDAKGTSPADALADVRVKAEEDLRTLKAYEKLGSDLENQKVLAISDGLDALAKQFQSQLGEKKDYTFTVGKNSSIFRSGTSETDPVHSKQVTDAVFELSGAIDPLTPMASVNNVLRTLAIAVPKQLSAVFVQITALAPVTQDDVRKYSATEYMRRLTSLELRDLTPDGKPAKGSEPYSLAGLKSRLNYRNVRAEDDKSTDTEADVEKATN